MLLKDRPSPRIPDDGSPIRGRIRMRTMTERKRFVWERVLEKHQKQGKIHEKTDQKSVTVELFFFLFFGARFLIKSYESSRNFTHSVPENGGPP